MVGRQGFEPWKPMAADLQSAPFVHSGTCPFHIYNFWQSALKSSKIKGNIQLKRWDPVMAKPSSLLHS